MTSKLKCPFCNSELHKDSDGYYTCYTDNCGCWANGGNGASGSESLWLTLIRTRKALEQSEICCTEWEKQALDYKAENIALSVKSEFVVDVLKEIDKLLSSNKFVVNECPLLNITQTKISMLLKFINIKQITALEQKESK